MSRYIDADALKKRVSELIVPDWTRTLIRSWLDSEPTVDAVPVVRCKECIEYRDSVGACHYFNYEPTDEMDFCSHGIRADGERRTE